MPQPDPPPLYLQIAESIRRRIRSGELPAGSRIPPVRSVAGDWGCTPGTVSRAYQLLAREGLVEGRAGSGTVVTGGSLPSPQPEWGWASLVHQAETFLLEALQEGFTLPDGEVAVSMAAARLRETLANESKAPRPSKEGAVADLRFAGSHDLLIDLLADRMVENSPPYVMSVSYIGSLGGLMGLARGEADLCGVHLWDAESQSYNTPFVERVLPGRRILLLTLAHRYLGLLLPQGNPQQVRNLADLTDPEVQFLNRQPGSGTRVWLDRQLSASRITPAEINGYDRYERTHTALARSIAQGQASAGFGIQAAAAQFGLDFLPLVREPFELVIPEEFAREKPAEALIAEVGSVRMKEAIRLMGGYEGTHTGNMRWLG